MLLTTCLFDSIALNTTPHDMMLAVIVLQLLLAIATAKPEYRGKLPNPTAHDIPGSGITCQRLGHEDCKTGNATVNKFGADFRAAGYVYTKEFCEKDSDEDGVPNGAELGDPCCNFVNGGEPSRTTDLSHPGERQSKPLIAANHVCTGQAAGTNTTSGSTSTPANGTSTSGADVPRSSPAATDPVCFPSDAKVTLQNGQVIAMGRLAVGDRVLVAPNTYSTVHMFTHALRDVHHEFVVLRTASNAMVTLTQGHYIHASGRLVRAGDVKMGDLLTLANGELSQVVRMTRARKSGLFNPQTLHGDIVVDGVVASTYTEFLQSNVAHALLSVFRACNAAFGMSSGVWHHGADAWFS